MRFVIDIDSTLADLVTPWVAAYRELHPDDDLTADGIWHYDTTKCVKYPLDIFKPFDAPGFFAYLQPLAGAIEVVADLVDAGHDVIIASAPALSSSSAADKLIWCRAHLPFVQRSNVMIGARKDVIKGDCLIDDNPDLARAYHREWPGALITGIEFPYNRNHRGEFDLLAPSYSDPGAAWATIRSKFVSRGWLKARAA